MQYETWLHKHKLAVEEFMFSAESIGTEQDAWLKFRMLLNKIQRPSVYPYPYMKFYTQFLTENSKH